MSELQAFVAMLDRAGINYSPTPDLHGTCVGISMEGYLTVEWFFDKAGKCLRTAKQSLATATPPDWNEITPNTCGGGP